MVDRNTGGQSRSGFFKTKRQTINWSRFSGNFAANGLATFEGVLMVAVHVTDSNFEQEVIKSDIPVLVDFWAPWCRPCVAIGAVLEELGGELQGKVKIVKIDINEHQKVASQLGIMTIPALYIYKSGQVVDKRIGNMPKPTLTSWIKGLIT